MKLINRSTGIWKLNHLKTETLGIDEYRYTKSLGYFGSPYESEWNKNHDYRIVDRINAAVEYVPESGGWIIPLGTKFSFLDQIRYQQANNEN